MGQIMFWGIMVDCVIDLKGNWDDHLPLVEFNYKNNYHFSIQIPPYQALRDKRCKYPIRWFEVDDCAYFKVPPTKCVIEDC